MIKPKGKKELSLEPGEYLAVIFSPQNCRLAPLRTVLSLKPFISHGISLIEGPGTKEVEAKENTVHLLGSSLL